uniref:RNA helicase n=1 Tax=Panagrellus redivivus TaxID=6233 RepID=A0A7E4VSZ6_PANRE
MSTTAENPAPASAPASGVPEILQPSDEAVIPRTEVSLLNKLLSKEINEMNEGRVEIRSLQSDPSSPLHSTETFESLRLKPELIAACYSNGFNQPSKIQSACIPLILRTPYPDVIAQAQNGTGKTATFLLSLLHRIDPKIEATQGLIIAPTIELAQQIEAVAKKLAYKMPEIKIRCAVRGEVATHGTVFNDHIFVGTPGTVEKWLVRFRTIQPEHLICTVVDEADDLFFMQNVKDNLMRILGFIKQNKPDCQMLFFSATFTEDNINFISNAFVPQAQYITLRRSELSLHHIKQCIIYCQSREEKYQAVRNIYASISNTASIIFAYTKASVDWLAARLKADGRSVATLHGNMTVQERAQSVLKFAQGDYKVLICTNVASRGLDIPRVTIVINYDPPVKYETVIDPNAMLRTDGQLGYADYDTYLHRIGRTGRFGRPGLAVNMADSQISAKLFSEIEQHFSMKMQVLDPNNYDALFALDDAPY